MKKESKAGKKVFVGLSGGVDSSVSAYLLKKEGYDVVGVFIKVWQPDFVACTWQEDRLDAMRVCAELSIPFETLDLEKEYKEGVIDYMLSEYKAGRTPNPDVACNKEVKFGAFLSWAKKRGADVIATGHYAQNIFNYETKEWELHKSPDSSKDQSYFLWTLGQNVLKQVLFPVGHLHKSEVRKIAEQAHLPTAKKKDSQGLCFISNVDMKDFLKHFITPKRGDVLNEKGENIGFHEGAEFVTLGERRGFTVVKKTPNDSPYYVVGKDFSKNTIIVSHKALSPETSRTIKLIQVNSISKSIFHKKKVTVQSRYHGKEIEAVLSVEAKNEAVVDLKEALLSPSGQSLVFFDKEKCLGGGVIV